MLRSNDNNSKQATKPEITFKYICSKMVNDPSYSDVVMFRELLRSDLKQITDALLQATFYFTNRYHLLAIGIALRYDANPNLYIRANNKSPRHILYYLGNRWSELSPEGQRVKLPLFRAVFALLVITGADINKLAIDEFAGRNISLSSTYKDKKSVRDIMIKDMSELMDFEITTTYNKNSNISGAIEEAEVFKSNQTPWVIGPKLLEFIGIMLNKPGLLVINKIDIINVPFILVTDANLFFNSDYIKFNLEEYSDNLAHSITDSSLISSAIEYISYKSFKCLLFRGHFPSYVVINNLIMLLLRYKSQHFMRMGVYKMLNYAISYGSYIDANQFKILRNATSKDELSEIDKLYSKPFWEKFLLNYSHYNYFDKGSKESEKSRLWDLMLPLSINPEQNIVDIGDKFYEYKSLDANKLKSALKHSVRHRLLKDLHLRIENRNIIISNEADLNGKLGDYGYLDGTLYYDKTDDSYWYFLRDHYIELKSTGKSIYTYKKLSNRFLSVISAKIAVFNTIGAGPAYMLSSLDMVEDGVDSLSKNDSIGDNKLSMLVLSCFKKILKDKTVDMKKLDGIIQTLGILSSVKPLNHDHQMITIAWIVRRYLKMEGNINKIKEYVN